MPARGSTSLSSAMRVPWFSRPTRSGCPSQGRAAQATCHGRVRGAGQPSARAQPDPVGLRAGHAAGGRSGHAELTGLDDPVPEPPVALDPTRTCSRPSTRPIWPRAASRSGSTASSSGRPAAAAATRCTRKRPRALHVHPRRRRARVRRVRAPAPTRAAAASATASRIRNARRRTSTIRDLTTWRSERAHERRAAPVPEPLVERPHGDRTDRPPAQVHHRQQRRGHDPDAHEHRAAEATTRTLTAASPATQVNQSADGTELTGTFMTPLRRHHRHHPVQRRGLHRQRQRPRRASVTLEPGAVGHR